MNTKKKAPAHEVILGRLQELATRLDHLRGTDDEEIGKQVGEGLCGELLGVLSVMHLPEQERPKILAALRALHSDVIDVHRAHVHLLKELSGGHDPAAETPQTARSR
jgi:hypothetical protein